MKNCDYRILTNIENQFKCRNTILIDFPFVTNSVCNSCKYAYSSKTELELKNIKSENR